MTPSMPVPAEPILQSLIDKALADLSRRLGIPVSEIIYVEAMSVTWPDGSLGCPKSGMEYTQVLTPGYLIQLQVDGQIFEYHASKGTTLIYCENPAPPVQGTPFDI